MKSYNHHNQALDTQDKAYTDCESCVDSPSAEYFYTPPLLMAFLLLFTLNTYQIYWFYKNWAAVKRAEKSNISCLLRGIFPIFFCHWLFKRVYHSAHMHQYKSHLSARFMTFLYVAGFLALNALDKVMALLFIPLASISLLLIQAPIKFSNLHNIPGYQARTGLTQGEVTYLVMFSVLWAGVGYVAYYYGLELAD